MKAKVLVPQGSAEGRPIRDLALDVTATDITGAVAGTLDLDRRGRRKARARHGGGTGDAQRDGTRRLSGLDLSIGSVTAKGDVALRTDNLAEGSLTIAAGDLADVAALALDADGRPAERRCPPRCRRWPPARGGEGERGEAAGHGPLGRRGEYRRDRRRPDRHPAGQRHRRPARGRSVRRRHRDRLAARQRQCHRHRPHPRRRRAGHDAAHRWPPGATRGRRPAAARPADRRARQSQCGDDGAGHLHPRQWRGDHRPLRALRQWRHGHRLGHGGRNARPFGRSARAAAVAGEPRRAQRQPLRHAGGNRPHRAARLPRPPAITICASPG